MANLLYLAKVKSIDGREMKIELAEDLNIERLQTVYHGHIGARYCELRFLDPRSFSVDQRKYYYALLGDISAFTGHLIEEIDDNTRWKFKALTGRNISLSNGSNNTKDDVVLLTNIALDLAFELDVSLSNKIPIPDKNLEYYFYKCLTHRKCCICGKHADIDHFDETVGMGNNRDKVDKTKYTYCALCRSHHTEKHTIGLAAFRNKYHVYGITLSAETIKRLNI
ncbi:putative HNHc nuclease [Enterococcus faecium]|uniref:putative HNHc nuclease n=1 Tax=Enterococcus faecium TaxID=1352 RepID=UPI00032FC3CB|nr:putative HNHc nuclease [Enterococcus faecium]EOM66617.1 hypothetical protein SK9_01817 [Enterococcus faecium EnGen0163]